MKSAQTTSAEIAPAKNARKYGIRHISFDRCQKDDCVIPRFGMIVGNFLASGAKGTLAQVRRKERSRGDGRYSSALTFRRVLSIRSTITPGPRIPPRS